MEHTPVQQTSFSTDHTIFWSGGDGIGLRYIPFTDSGIFEVDYSGVLGGAGSYDWNIHIPDAANDTIGNDEVLTVSGVSGVDLNYIASTNNLIVSAHTHFLGFYRAELVSHQVGL